MLVEIREKSVYGNVLLYPSNEVAQTFAKLLNKKTFYHKELELIKALGHEVRVIKLWY
mgnify:CR=1 FL=1|jgi:hypothetical protein|tara:strand:- start:748 stop:921 length:174 start_codon:yes stop_codon:yes gene_type:complete